MSNMRSGEGFQFAHVDWSARSGAKKKTAHNNNGNSTRNKSWSAREIADEAERIDGACNHVENPQAPGLVYGVAPHAAVDRAEKWAESQSDTYQKKTKKGIVEIKRGYRADAPIMSNGVISLPREREADWPAFRDASVRWLKNHYRERLVSVIEHLDERHPHLHFYCVPLPGEDFGAVHEGYAASREARGGDNKICTAYKAAMKLWQDDFYAGVAQHFRLARIGPARERKEREAALIDRTQLELEEKQRELDVKQHEIEAADAVHKIATDQLVKAQKKFITQVNAFKVEQNEFKAKAASWQTSGTKLGTLFKSVRTAMSSDTEIERLTAENNKIGQRVAQAVKAETARWAPALKGAQEEARYQKMLREDAEKKRIAAEEKLARLERTSTTSFNAGLSGPK